MVRWQWLVEDIEQDSLAGTNLSAIDEFLGFTRSELVPEWEEYAHPLFLVSVASKGPRVYVSDLESTLRLC